MWYKSQSLRLGKPLCLGSGDSSAISLRPRLAMMRGGHQTQGGQLAPGLQDNTYKLAFWSPVNMWICLGLPWWLRWKRIHLQFRKPRFDPWVEKILWRRKWQPTPVFLPGKSMDGGDWLATVLGVTKSWTELSDFTIDFTIEHLLTWRVHLSVSYLFAFSYCSWGSQG